MQKTKIDCPAGHEECRVNCPKKFKVLLEIEFYAGHPIDATNAVILLEDTIKRFDPVVSCKQHDLECFHLNEEEQKKALKRCGSPERK